MALPQTVNIFYKLNQCSVQIYNRLVCMQQR